MSSEQFREQGIAAAKAGRKEDAKKLLQRALKLNPQDEMAWLFFASVQDDKKQRLLCLQKVLEINPQNDTALKAVTAMGIDPAQLLTLSKKSAPQSAPQTAPPPEPEPEPEPEPDDDGVGDLIASFDAPPAPPAPPVDEADEDDELPYSPYDDDDELPYSPYDDEPDVSAPASTRASTPVFETSADDAASADAFSGDDDDELPYSPYDDDDELPYSPYDDDFEEFSGDFEDFEEDVVYDPNDPFAVRDEDDLDFSEFEEASMLEPSDGSDFDDLREAFVPEITSTLPRPPQRDESVEGLPIPDIAYLEKVLVYAEEVGEQYMQPPTGDITWVHKTRRRAGEGDPLRLRLQVGAAVAVGLIVLLVVGGSLALSNPSIRVVFIPNTPTPTNTPTFTPTNTPGLTETPTATLDATQNATFTPSPTINGTFTPVGVVGIRTPRPTVPYLPPRELEGPVLEVARGLDRNDDPNLLVATMEVERRLVSNIFDPNPYYYSAIALVRDDQYDRAIEVMNEAETRLSESTADDQPQFKAVVDLGFAEVYLQHAIDLLENFQTGTAFNELTLARERAQNTIAFNPRFARAYIIIARSLALQGDYEAGAQVLEDALNRAEIELGDNTAMIIELGLINLQQGRAILAAGGNPDEANAAFARAKSYGDFAEFLNTYDEQAHELRIEAALAQGRPGEAVLYNRDYRLALPESANAYRLLGEARELENNTDLALEAYSVALQLGGESSDALTRIFISRGDLFFDQQRYNKALEDYSAALEVDPVPALRVQRMQAAYLAEDYETALADVEELRGSGAVPDGDLSFIEARIAIDTADPDDLDAIQAALNTLNSISVSASQTAALDEYQARALYLLGEYDQALANVDSAIQQGESGSRRFLRGLISEAATNLEAALRDYEWVLAWDSVYGFEFGDEVRVQYRAVSTEAFATRTAVFEETLAFEATGTAEAGAQTATAEASLTVTATPTATP